VSEPVPPPWVAQVLAARPVHARPFDRDAEDRVAIRVPRFDGAILRRLLMPRLRRPEFRIRLDAFGTCAWDACDGRRTGEDIAALLSARWPDEPGMRLRAAMFLRQLLIQGHLRDAGADGDGPPPG
jgi:hypothetical protein